MSMADQERYGVKVRHCEPCFQSPDPSICFQPKPGPFHLLRTKVRTLPLASNQSADPSLQPFRERYGFK
eukprot:3603940-Prymnesium_polylepis.1